MFQKAFVRLDLPWRNEQSNQSVFPPKTAVNELQHSRHFHSVLWVYYNNSWCLITTKKLQNALKMDSISAGGKNRNDTDAQFWESRHLMVKTICHLHTADVEEVNNDSGSMVPNAVEAAVLTELLDARFTPLLLHASPVERTQQMEMGNKTITINKWFFFLRVALL